jgi:hypothetical protein
MAELHYRQHPYPDECVFLVTGGGVKNGMFNLAGVKSLIIIGRTVDDVSEMWRRETEVVDDVALSCVSLAQASDILEKLTQAKNNESGFTKIPTTSFFSFGQSKREPWCISIEDSGGKSQQDVVLAHRIDDIEAWAKAKGINVTSGIPHSLLESTVAKMIEAKLGKAMDEIYAKTEKDVGEFFDQLRNRTLEEKKVSLIESMRLVSLMRSGR